MGIKKIRGLGLIRNKSITRGKTVIGVIGTHIGAGSTHFSILLSNYISECLGKKTACIECFPQNELKYMEEAYDLDGNATSLNDSFSIYKVHYYKSIKEERIAEIIGYGYDCVVLDLGIDLNKKRNEFFRCDKKIVISNLAIWKYKELENFMAKTGEMRINQEWEFGINFSTKKNTREMSRQYKIPMFHIPNEPDPFAISTDTIKIFQKII